MSNNLKKLLLEKKSFSCFKNFLNYLNQLFNVFILFIGVLAFEFSFINLMIGLTLLLLGFDILFSRFSYPNKLNIPSPQRILNLFLVSSSSIYIIENITEVLYYIEIILCTYFIFYILKVLIHNRIESLDLSIKEYSTPVHELGHFFINEEYKMFKSVLIDLVPNGKSLGRLEIKPSTNNINVENFVSFLMSGHMASQYLLYNQKPDVKEIIEIVNLELESVNFSNREPITEILNDQIRVYKIIDSTLDLIKRKKDKIITLASKIQGKEKVLCKELTL